MFITHKPVTTRMQITLLLVALLACIPLQAVRAQSSYPNGLIPAGETVQGSLFLFSPEVDIDGIVDGDVFVISQNVNVTGEIKGSLFVLSTVATIDGVLEGDLFTANSRLTIEPAARIGRSAYGLAGLVDMLPGSEVGRDLYLIALSGQLSGSVGRYQRAHLGFLELLVLLFGDNGLLRPILPPSFRLPLSAMEFLAASPAERALQWSFAATAAGLPALAISTILAPGMQTAPFDAAALGSWFVAQLRVFAPLLLIGLLLLWLFPRFLQGTAERLRARPLACFGTGVVVFFVGYGVAMLALALVVALGLFFATFDFWNLALMSWGAGLGGLGVALAFFGLAIVYLSKIIIAYLFGAILLSQIPAATWGRRFWMLLLGVVIVVLLLAIPILGWVLSVLGSMFGLGSIYLHLRQRGQPVEAPAQDLPAQVVEELSAPQAPVELTAPINIVDSSISAEPEAAVVTIAEVEAPIEAIPEPYTEMTQTAGAIYEPSAWVESPIEPAPETDIESIDPSEAFAGITPEANVDDDASTFTLPEMVATTNEIVENKDGGASETNEEAIVESVADHKNVT